MHQERFSLGPVELRVTDTGRAARFWQLIGLTETVARDDAVALGVGDETLVVLRSMAFRPVQPGHTGLYHVAVHFPDEVEFGRALARLATAGAPVALVDHLFSKAIYLRDPDGIAVELALETPWRMREMRVDARRGLHVIDHEGRVLRPSEPLDVGPLLAAADGHDFAAPAEGASIGHLHLSVPDLGAAFAFYRDELGMVGHMNEPAIGFADLHAGGDFHHRIALNTFSGPGAPPTPADMAGLDRFAIRYHAAAPMRPATARRVHDPAGNTIDLMAEPHVR